MAAMEHYKKKGERENKTRLLALIKQHGNLTFSGLKALLKVSSPTLSGYLKELENSNTLERFRNPGEDRRIERYRIKHENMERVEAQVRQYDAIKFIEGIENPVYVYRESDDGKKAIAAFASIPGLRGLAQKLIQAQISGYLPLLKVSPSSQKLAIVIMIKGGGISK